MKRQIKWVLAVLGLVAVPVLAHASLAGAQKFSSTLDKDHTVNSSMYSAGKNVDIEGTVNGDVFCAGQTVKVDATVHGDVICAGQDVTISGKIDGNIRVAGQTVNVDAAIGRNATVAGATFSLDASAKVGQDLTAVGSDLNIKGAVTRDVVASGNQTTFNGVVGRNVKVSGNKVDLRSNAMVAGNFEYTSANKIDQEHGAIVKGDTHHITPPKKQNRHHFSLVFYLFALGSLLLITLVLAYFFPDVLRKNSKHITDSFAKTLAVGLIASFLVPAVAAALAFSIVGIPLTVFMMVAWLFGAMLSGPIVAYYVGDRILRKRSSLFASAALGSLVLVTAYFLPLIGILALMLAYWLGFGALLQSLQAHIKTPTAKKTKK